MTALVRQLRRTETVDAPTRHAEPVDYCQCNRGPVIGAVKHTNNQMWFFPIGFNPKAAWPEYAIELRCVDCVAETASALADGTIDAQYREEAHAYRESIAAMQRRSQISVTDQSRQTAPSEGEQVT